MKLALTMTAASIIALSSAVSAEQQLSMAEMDNVSAGGIADAFATAAAFGNLTLAQTLTDSKSTVIGTYAAQVGAIDDVYSEATAQSTAAADGKAAQLGEGFGVTTGTLFSDTVSSSDGVADATFPFAWNVSSNTSLGASAIIGAPASAMSSSFSVVGIGTGSPVLGAGSL